MGVLRDLKIFFTLVGLAAFAFLIICLLGFFPSSVTALLPSQLKTFVAWTTENAMNLIFVFCFLLGCYVTMKAMFYLERRQRGIPTQEGA